MDLHRHFQLHPVILLPLRPAPTHNDPQKTPNNSMAASRWTQRSIDRYEDVFVENPVRVISVAINVAVV